ncbi:hypothetical protein LJR175_008316 [Variovorax sp. LjRoot175]|uniref:hypothetical protein n=1 Tax=Variovorax sp. LjRoot175 TaxID=3342276 RepID=UPI003ED0DF97
MQASFDLFAELAAPAPSHAAGDAVAQPAVQRHPWGAQKTRAGFREDLVAANVATVRFDIRDGGVFRVSQFIPAGNQCIGIYPGPLKAIGQVMLDDLMQGADGVEGWTGVIEWDVPGDQARCAEAPSADDDRAPQTDRPRL